MSRPYIKAQDLIPTSENSSVPPLDETSSLVIPLPQEISQLESSEIQQSDQNIAVVVENPFDCLAPFYFPEHVEFNSISENDTVKSEKLASEHTYDFGKLEEEFNQQTENAQFVSCASGNDRNRVIKYVPNLSEVVTDVPNLVKILQTKSQKKIFLEERK